MLTPVFDASQEAALKDFFGEELSRQGRLSYYELHGMLVGVLSAPEVIMPSAWMPLIWEDEEADPFEDEAQATAIFSALMTLQNHLNQQILDHALEVPEPCHALGDRSPSTPFSQWCRGFVIAYQFLEDLWTGILSECRDAEVVEQFEDSLGIISVGVDIPQALHELTQDNPKHPLLDDIHELPSLVEESANYISQLGRSLSEIAARVQDEMSEEVHEPYVREFEKVGRNDPCPCGSGKKYKKCCMG